MSYLPHGTEAYVPREKLLGYLLSEANPRSRGKAKFFRRLGYNEDNVDRLRHGLLEIAAFGEVEDDAKTPWGRKYVVIGELGTPAGPKVSLLTVWIREHGDLKPRFVTAYPRKKT